MSAGFRTIRKGEWSPLCLPLWARSVWDRPSITVGLLHRYAPSGARERSGNLLRAVRSQTSDRTSTMTVSTTDMIFIQKHCRRIYLSATAPNPDKPNVKVNIMFLRSITLSTLTEHYRFWRSCYVTLFVTSYVPSALTPRALIYVPYHDYNFK
jgi:hypothetical protein